MQDIGDKVRELQLEGYGERYSLYLALMQFNRGTLPFKELAKPKSTPIKMGFQPPCL